MATWRSLKTWILLLLVLIAALALWFRGLAKDVGPDGRPHYGPYTWAQASADQAQANNQGPNPQQPQAPRGGPVPRADGYVMGSEGHDTILPPMPPARSTDIARADNAFKNNALATCFWPGPKLRPGYYTTDPDDYGIENQLPDTGNTFSTAWFKLPADAKLVISGNFPNMRHWSFVTYTEAGVPLDGLNDIDIEADAGSYNPFRAGVARDVQTRRYTFTVVNGKPPADAAQRPKNTVYTLNEPNTAIGMHMRNYVPDRSIDWTGGVGVPKVQLQTTDGKLLNEQETCDATQAPLRGKQVPITVPRKLWLALNSLPWRPADRTPAKDFDVAPMVRFFNREHLLLQTFFPLIPSDGMAVEKGGFWSNPVTRYGFTYLSQAYGSVYAVHGKMPTTPTTWHGQAAPLDVQANMRYWSLCTVTAPASGNTVDCVHDENVRPLLDPQGHFTVVISRAPDRPSNAKASCGVEWLEYGTGDGIPGGSADYGTVINRHTLVNPDFKHSWFNVTKVGDEAKEMGDYLPHVINLRAKAKFEALGCPVDKAKLAAMIGNRP